jgi:hypothetical protein
VVLVLASEAREIALEREWAGNQGGRLASARMGARDCLDRFPEPAIFTHSIYINRLLTHTL